MAQKGGTKVKGGFYWKKGGWEIVTVAADDGMLPGGSEAQYIRFPDIVLLPIALVLTLAAVIVVPLLGLGLLFHSLCTWLGLQIRQLNRVFGEVSGR